MVEQYGWCVGYHSICEEIWGCAAYGFVSSTFVIVAAWTTIYYFLAYVVYAFVEGNLKKIPSKYDEENNRHWFANHVNATLLSLACIYWVGSASAHLTGASSLVQFGPPSAETVAHGYTGDVVQIVKGAQTFLGYVLMDVIVGFGHGTLKSDMVAHHVLFIFFGTMVFYNCFGQYLVGCMLLMEVSTVFLNYFSFFRNRVGFEDHWTIAASFGLFALAFVAFRLVALVYVGFRFIAAVLGFEGARALALSNIASWQVDSVILVVVAAMALQSYWAVGIAQKVAKRFSSSDHGTISPVHTPIQDKQHPDPEYSTMRSKHGEA